MLLIELIGWAAFETNKKPRKRDSTLGITRKTIADLPTR